MKTLSKKHRFANTLEAYGVWCGCGCNPVCRCNCQGGNNASYQNTMLDRDTYYMTSNVKTRASKS